MAELAEVETFRRQLERRIRGKSIGSVWIRKSSLVFRSLEKGANLSKALQGAKILQLKRRCKYLFLETDKGLTLIIHPGMTGNLFIRQNDERRDQHCHLELYFDKFKLTFRDPRMFGRVMLAKSENLSCIPSIGCLGPEPLSKEFNANWLYEKVYNRKVAIKSLLLDQRIGCGVGNIYADEACFRAGISPLRYGRDLKKQELKRLASAIKFVLKRAIKNAGTTIRDYKTSEGKTGSNRPAMYGREGKPCKRCGGTIIKTAIAGRVSFYCPSCQV